MSSLALFFLLCLSMHACHARPLADVQSESHSKIVVKDGEKITTGISFLLIPFSLISKAKASVEISESEKNGNMESISKEVLQQGATKLKGLRRSRARLMLESTTQQDSEENVDSKEESGDVEDVVAMDYAQPRRKPPIHNEEH